MTEFSQLGLAEPLMKALTKSGYTTPTPIQAQAIPAVMEGKDVVGIAQTGTGKTAAFLLPLLHLLHDSSTRPSGRGCSALILAPTRELASQIAENLRNYARFTAITSTVVVGGAKPGPQVRAMKGGVDILIATPGRLLDHVGTGAISLKNTRAVVLDEADQMMDLGFMPAIRDVMKMVAKDRQTILLSATMPKPIRALAADFLTDPEEIAVAPQSTPIERIDQKVLHAEMSEKREALLDILGKQDVNRAIVFTRTKRGADKVATFLADYGLKAGALHGNKSQSQRQRILASFKSGKAPILVATDIAARGIDVDGVSHVINFELPNIPEAYVHRIGRTARAGNDGMALTLCDGSERSWLRNIERLIGMPIPALNDPQGPERAPPSMGGGKGGGGGRGRGGPPRSGKPRSRPGSNGAPHRARSKSNGGGNRQRRAG